MPRTPGHDKLQVERRYADETVQFNSRTMAWELELLSLLLEQEMRTKDTPSERLINAKETVERLIELNQEIIEA